MKLFKSVLMILFAATALCCGAWAMKTGASVPVFAAVECVCLFLITLFAKRTVKHA